MERVFSQKTSWIKIVAIVLALSTGFVVFALPSYAAAPGGTCSSDSDCGDAECGASGVGCFCSGLIAGPTGTCVTKRAAGEACNEDVQCQTGTTCNIAPGVLRCEAVAAAPSTPSTPSSPTEPAPSAPPPTRTPGEFGYVNPLGTVSINVVLGRVIRTVLGFVGALFLAMFVYGGTVWMLAGGDAKKVESGRKALVNAVIGIIIVALSYSIISIIFETANVIRG